MRNHSIVLLFLAVALSAPAAMVTSHSSLVNWSSASTNTAVIDFEGVYANNTGAFQPGGQVTVGGVNITALNSNGRLYWFGPNSVYGPSSNLTTQPLAPQQLDALQLTLATARTSLAFDLANFRSGENVDITFRFIDSSTVTLNAPTLAVVGPGNLGQFFGFTADLAFDRVTIARTAILADAFSRGLWIDNIRTGDTVPEPATAALTLVALAGGACLRRERKQLRPSANR
jgi:hypothetical protein